MRLTRCEPRPLAGPLVPRSGWGARVEGVFRDAIALAHPDGLWITILRSAEDLEPRGIWLGSYAYEALAGLAVPGGSVAFSGGDSPVLTVAGAEIRLGALAGWDPRTEVKAAARVLRAAGSGAVHSAADFIAAALDADDYQGGFRGGVFGRRFIELRSEPGFPFNLIGFGPGTTPAGDDFLSGWILGCILSGGGRRACAAAAAYAALTNVPGLTLLAGALKGMFPAYLVRVAVALAGKYRHVPSTSPDSIPGSSPLAEAFRSAFRHGASSGRDALMGMEEGLRKSILAPRAQAAFDRPPRAAPELWTAD